jgi:hypothetical protein
MADHYCRASFSIIVTAAEAALMDEVLTLDLDDLTPSELDGFYQLRSPEFREAFPGTTEDPFAGLRALFTDPQDLSSCCTMQQEDAACGGVALAIYGDNVDIEALANLLHIVCRSAHPFGFCFSYGCSKLRAGEFGGGYAIVTSAAVTLRDTDSELQRALAEPIAAKDRPVRPVCKECGSNDLTRDACARWDDELQDWIASGVYDCTNCGSCGAESDDLAEWLALPLRSATAPSEG